MTGVALDFGVALLKCKSRIAMRRQVKQAGAKFVLCVAFQTRPRLPVFVDKLPLVHVLMANRALIGGSPRISIGKVLPCVAHVADGAGQSVVRST